MDSDSDNKQSKKSAAQNLIWRRLCIKHKKIDAEIEKREQELRKRLVEKAEKEVSCCHELVMLENAGARNRAIGSSYY